MTNVSLLDIENGFEKTLKNESLSIGESLLEVTLDNCKSLADLAIITKIDEKILKEIPILGILVSVVKVGNSARDFFFIKKLMMFISNVQRNQVSIKDKVDFMKKLHGPEKDKIIEALLIFNDRFNDMAKSKVLAFLFINYINRSINWVHFNHLGLALESLHPLGYEYLHKVSLDGCTYHGQATDLESILMAASLSVRSGTRFSLTELGRDLYTYGIKCLFTPS